MKKHIRCKECGELLKAGAIRCDNCGFPVKYDRDNKTGNSSKKFVIGVCVVIIGVITVSSLLHKSKDNDDYVYYSSATSGSNTHDTGSSNKTSEKTYQKDDITETDNKLKTSDIFELVKISAGNNFDSVNITFSDSYPDYYCVTVSKNGFALAMTGYDSSNLDNINAYNKMISSFQGLCKTYNDELRKNDLEGEFAICIMNDLNKDKTLIAVSEDDVLYSAFE